MTPKAAVEDLVPGLAFMPYVPNRQAALTPADCDSQIVFLHDRHSPSAEQYSRIVSRLVSDHPMGGILMVTSPTPGDGKTLSSINLALCFAERAPALLIDLDTRHSTVRRKLNIPPSGPGIEDALLESAPADACLLSIPGTRLCTCINRGDGHPIIDLMSLGRPKRLLDWALHRFIWVIIDTPPAFPIADTLEIANHVSIGLMVVRARKTPGRLLQQAMAALRGHINYVVLNDCEAPSYSIYNDRYYTDLDTQRWGRR